jgi:hypothetical protein
LGSSGSERSSAFADGADPIGDLNGAQLREEDRQADPSMM